MSTLKYSVVIPLKDEDKNIVPLLFELETVMRQLGMAWELICVDDGSKDGTRLLLEKLAVEKPFLKAIFLDRNYGQSTAFAAGFEAAQGEFLITLDGDRQNDPADIPNMIQEISDCDLVCGIRQKRRDPFQKRLISWLANAIRSRICRDEVRDTGCSLKVYRTACLKQIKMYHGLHRFLPALFLIEGFRIKQVPVNHRMRLAGKTKYNVFNRSLNTFLDLFAVWWMQKRKIHYKIDRKLP